MKQKLIELTGKIDKFTVVGNLSTAFQSLPKQIGRESEIYFDIM
jgi:hypothetical protein